MRVITANIRHRLAPADVRRHLDLIAASSPDVIGPQEMGGRRGVLTEWAAANGYQLIMPDVPGVSGESSTPLLIRAGIPILASGGIQATEATTVPAAARGPRRYPPKWVTWADLPGVRIYNLHMPASLYLPKMRALAVQVAEAVSEHAAGQMRVVVMGDFNTTKPLDLFDPFDGLTDVSEQLGSRPTLRRRDIDRVLYSGTKALRQSTISGLSDHRARLVDLDITLEAPVFTPVKYDFAKILRDAGLKVVEIDGWRTRGRPAYTGEFEPVGVLWHHTGGPGDGKEYAEWLARVGRPDLPPPLCQLSVGRDGTWYVIAAGRANHAGEARASGTVAAGDGNALYVGVECHNSGTEGWSPDQYDSMVRGGAALGKALGTSVQTQRAHYETSVTGKWDPGDPNGKRLGNNRVLDMDAFRARINALMMTTPKPAEPSRGGNIDSALKELDQAAKHAERTKQPKRLAKIRAAIESLLSIKTKG